MHDLLSKSSAGEVPVKNMIDPSKPSGRF